MIGGGGASQRVHSQGPGGQLSADRLGAGNAESLAEMKRRRKE